MPQALQPLGLIPVDPSKVVDATTGAIVTVGGGSGGGAVTMADGANVTQGNTADAAVQGDTAGTLSAKMRGLIKALGTNTDAATVATVLGYLNYLKTNIPASGQKAMAGSLPVVISSDQNGIPIFCAPGFVLETNARLKDGFGQAIRGVTITGGIYQIQSNTHETATYLNVASATMNLGATGGTTTYADYPSNNIGALLVDFNVTAVGGTAPTLQIMIDRKGVDGIYYNIYASSASGTIAATSVEIGIGCSTNKGLGAVIRARAIIGGSATPTVTFSMSIQAVS